MSREEIYSIPDPFDFARAIVEDASETELARQEENAELRQEYRFTIK